MTTATGRIARPTRPRLTTGIAVAAVAAVAVAGGTIGVLRWVDDGTAAGPTTARSGADTTLITESADMHRLLGLSPANLGARGSVAVGAPLASQSTIGDYAASKGLSGLSPASLAPVADGQ